MLNRRSVLLPVLSAAVSALLAVAPRAQQVTFRTGVDLVVVDTQVVDHEGSPIGALDAKDFRVWINGHPRQIVSADLIKYPLSQGISFSQDSSEKPDWIHGDLPDVRGRLFVLAVDELSFGAVHLREMMQAATQFVGGLTPDDVVGVYAYPLGTRNLNLSHDHSAVIRELQRLEGLQTPFYGTFNLTPSELIDLTARDGRATSAVIARECPANDPSCPTRLLAEADARAGYEESLATESFVGLRKLLDALRALPGPKNVVLLSAGMLSSDRGGGRPDVTSLLKTAGRDAAAADARLYVLHLDTFFVDSLSVANHPVRDASAISHSSMRDNLAMALGLQQVAGEAGGEYLPIRAGTGDSVFRRVLTETAAYYLLGVAPEAADRDGRVHYIRVEADVKGATVRARKEVTIPKS